MVIVVKFTCNCTEYMLITYLYGTNYMLVLLSIFLNKKVAVSVGLEDRRQGGNNKNKQKQVSQFLK